MAENKSVVYFGTWYINQDKSQVGDQIMCLWKGDDCYYPAVVLESQRVNMAEVAMDGPKNTVAWYGLNQLTAVDDNQGRALKIGHRVKVIIFKDSNYVGVGVITRKQKMILHAVRFLHDGREVRDVLDTDVIPRDDFLDLYYQGAMLPTKVNSNDDVWNAWLANYTPCLTGQVHTGRMTRYQSQTLCQSKKSITPTELSDEDACNDEDNTDHHHRHQGTKRTSQSKASGKGVIGRCKATDVEIKKERGGVGEGEPCCSDDIGSLRKKKKIGNHKRKEKGRDKHVCPGGEDPFNPHKHTKGVEYMAYRGIPLPPILTPSAAAKRHDGVLQTKPCHGTPAVTAAHLECKWCRLKKGSLCSFQNTRTLYPKKGQAKGGGLSAVSFLTDDKAPACDPRWDPHRRVSRPTASYLIRSLGPSFTTLIAEELGMVEQSKRLCGVGQVYWKPLRSGHMEREICDMCQTSLFNRHYNCRRCCFSVCSLCMQEASEKLAKIDTSQRIVYSLTNEILGRCSLSLHEYRYMTLQGDDFTSGRRMKEHLPIDFMLLGSIPTRVLTALKDQMREAFATVYETESTEKEELKAREDSVVYLYDPKHPDNQILMAERIKKSLPVVVGGVNQLMKRKWLPETLRKHFPKEMVMLINCNDSLAPYEMSCTKFWASFQDVSKRQMERVKKQTNEGKVTWETQPVSLKLKDWPPGRHFKEALPYFFDDFLGCLPCPDYTKPNGHYNLAHHLREMMCPPDLGPKIYVANGQWLDVGTTNLHIDMSDAINIMAYVGDTAQDPVTITCMEKDKENVTRAWNPYDECAMEPLSLATPVGAAWHIWRSHDAAAIRQYILEKKPLELQKGSDTIHDQSVYITAEDRRILEQRGIKAFFIQQRLGEAVIIPAGAPHQVRNYVSCIKIAEDFVCPENVEECIKVTNEFRKLSPYHTNKEDKLQIRNIIFHAAKDALHSLNGN